MGVSWYEVRANFVEPKADGWWCEACFSSNVVHLFSKTSDTLDSHPIPGLPFEAIIYGEYLLNTEWGKAFHEKTGIKLLAFDIDHPGPYGERRAHLEEVVEQFGLDWLAVLPSFPLKSLTPSFWEHWVLDLDWEGVVYKSDTTRPGSYDDKKKNTETWDFVVTRVLTSDSPFRRGMATGFGLGVYHRAGLDTLAGPVEMGKVTSGFTFAELTLAFKTPARFIGNVIEVRGQSRTKSGAVREPRFVRWREDKRPEECVE